MATLNTRQSKISPHEERIKQAFLPSEAHPRQRVVVLLLTDFLNGNWQQAALRHHCAGCCQDAGHAKQKLKRLMRKFLTSLRPAMFSEDNWLNWGSSLAMFAFGHALHQFLPKLVVRIFGSGSATTQHGDPAGEDGAVLLQ
eukprot:6440567-Amphidinium_carterae.1